VLNIVVGLLLAGRALCTAGNPQVRLVRDQQLDSGGVLAGAAEHRADRFGMRTTAWRKTSCRPCAANAPLRLLLGPGIRRHQRSRTFDPELLGVSAFAMEIERQDPASVGIGRLQDDGSGPVGKDHRRVASLSREIHSGGLDFLPDHQDAAEGAAPDVGIGDGECIDETGALHPNVDRRNGGGDGELALQVDAVAGKKMIRVLVA
jgi:hypothetical protein